MGAIIAITNRLESMVCAVCGVNFAVPEDFAANQRVKGAEAKFYCPGGHMLSFGESESVRLKRELERKDAELRRVSDLAQRREKENQQLYKTKRQLAGKLRAVKKRVANGVCPCCNRSFVQLTRHMRTKHPDYVQHQNELEEPESTAP